MFKLITTTLAAAIGLGAAQASAQDPSREFLLVNHSNHEITQVIASNIGVSTFVPIDLLGDETVGPYDSLSYRTFQPKSGSWR